MIEKIIGKFPKIDNDSLFEVTNIVEQSKQFRNFNNKEISNNDFELEYAHYLATDEESFLEKYKNVVIEACFREFMEWYEYLTKHILRKDVQEALGIDFDASESDWVGKVKQSDVFGWAFQIKNQDKFLHNIDKVQKLGQIMVNFFNARKPLSILDQDYFESDHVQLVLDSIDKIIVANDNQELVNQIKSEKIICMIEVYGWENRFNPILLEWFYLNREKLKTWI